MTKSSSIVSNVKTLLASVVIYLLTFPNVQPDYTIGLDSSYIWALNHLFANDYQSLKALIYPLGPLAFLKNPVVIGMNFEIFLVFYTVIKLWFTYLLISLAGKFGNKKTLSYVLVTMMLLLFSVDYILVALAFIYGFLFLTQPNRNGLYIALAVVLATVGMAIKSSLGIMMFSIIGMACLIDLFQAKQYKEFGKSVGIGLITFLITGLLIFFNISSLASYSIHVVRLALGYSSALSVFPDNNWLLLAGFIATLGIPALFRGDKHIRYAWLLLLPTVFAMWKHSMSRQDYSHAGIMFVFLFLYWGIFIVISNKHTGRFLLAAAASIMLYYSNLHNLSDFSPKSIQVNGIVNFEEVVLDLDSFKSRVDSISKNDVSNNQLSEGLITSVLKDRTIDSYPWELSYFAANQQLSWKPRRTLQSGSFAPWLDKYNAIDFNRQNGPEYLIFHFGEDRYGGKFGSIDNRYLLNDNPRTIHNIFNYYSPKLKTGKFLLLAKNEKDNLSASSLSELKSSNWNTWIDVSEDPMSISRIHVSIDLNFLGKVRSFLFKSGLYEIDYELDSGEILTYRFVPANAVDGIWINPLILNPMSTLENRVVKIRFRTSTPRFNKEAFTYQFETFAYVGDGIQKPFSSYFEDKIASENILVNYFNDFEIMDDKSTTEAAFSGQSSNLVRKLDGFSHTYSVLLDTLWTNVDASVNTLTVKSNLLYQNTNSQGSHVVTVENSESDLYNSKELLITKAAWKNSTHSIEINRNEHEKGLLKIYVWNVGNSDLYVDDFKVMITKLSAE